MYVRKGIFTFLTSTLIFTNNVSYLRKPAPNKPKLNPLLHLYPHVIETEFRSRLRVETEIDTRKSVERIEDFPKCKELII